MDLRVGEKFAIVAFFRINLHHTFPQSIDLGSGFFATRKLPGSPDEHWKEWLGSIKSKELEEANLYIGRRMISKSPDILDNENQELQNDVNALYWSIFISDFVCNHQAPKHLTGTMLETGMNIRQIGTMQIPFSIPGTPLDPRIDIPRLELTVKLAQALKNLFSKKEHRRLKLVIHAYSAGINASLADVRLHQFIRCIEGFILPEIGHTRKQFISRSQLFVGSKHQNLIGKLYDLRSRAEHLHDVLDIIGDSSERNKLISLFRHTFEAEGIAKYCIKTFLLNNSLHPYFVNDDALRSFWTLDEPTRKQLWGDSLELSTLTKRFEPKYIQDEELND